MNSPQVPGFRFSGVHCGIKRGPRELDLALIASDEPASWAGVFTQSSVVGAPVEWSRACVSSGRGRGVVVNSGISNVAMGRRGKRDAAEMASLAAKALGCRPKEVCVCSTGVIGEPLPMAKLRAGIPLAGDALSEDGIAAAADAIRTTDTFAKVASTRVRIGGKLVRVAGISKGSGMIHPDMATMLGFLITEASSNGDLQEQLQVELLEEARLKSHIEEIKGRTPPDAQGLDIPAKRSINYMIIAYAQQLFIQFGDGAMVGLVKEASEKSVGSINYGSEAECAELQKSIHACVDFIEGDTDFADILQKRAKLISEKALFNKDDDAVPVPATVSTLFNIDERGKVSEADANLLGENYWRIATILSR